MTRDRRPPSPGLPARRARRSPADPSVETTDRASTASPADPSVETTVRSAELGARIRSEIESSRERRITFARYMERALYEPGLGYYGVAADRPTDTGDFLTAPETHAIFGWTIARRIEALWQELDRPGPFTLVEYGAGSGTLALSIIDGFRRHGSTDLLDAVRYEAIESNPNRVADLSRRFEEAGLHDKLVERRDASTPEPTSGSFGSAAPTASGGLAPVTGIVIANEFLDALPVHRVVMRGGTLLELFVVLRDPGAEGANDGRGVAFAEEAALPSTPELAARLAGDRIELAEGQVAEICLGLDPWLGDAAARLDRGYVIAIDYGYEAAELYGPRRRAGTLLGYRGHQIVDDPFVEPGAVDLTAHVDFSALQRLAMDRGFRTVSLTTQSEFLVAAGLEEELRALQARPDLALGDYLRARSGIVRLLDPRHMGRFRVLTLARGT